MGKLVLVATKGSSLYIFDKQRHNILRKFDVTPIITLLGVYKNRRERKRERERERENG